MSRFYKAILVDCPECKAKVFDPCRDDRRLPMRGVHRRRDVAYNQQQRSDPELWEPKR